MNMDNRKKWKTFILVTVSPLFLLFVLNGIISDWYVEQKLGRGYNLYYRSSGESIIMFGGSYEVINEAVYSCDHDRNWIIIKTKSKKYYIIDKHIPFSSDNPSKSIIGPLDSFSFYTIKAEKEIPLGLRTIPQNDK